MHPHSKRRAIALGLAACQLLLVVSPALSPRAASAQDATPAQILERARGCYRDGDYACVIDALQAPVKSRALKGDDLVAAMELLARGYVSAGRADEGKAVFKELLCERRDWKADENVETPEEYTVYKAALSENPCRPVPPPTPKPFWKKPWAWGAGAAVLGGTAVALLGGKKGDGKTTLSDLPGPPNPPGP